jgi:hypothetical protein
MAKNVALKPKAAQSLPYDIVHFPIRKWWDPVPDWFRTINKEQWFRFNELEIELRKKELEIDQQRLQGLKNITK